MNFYAVSALINIVTSLLLGLLIFSKKKTALNISFVLFCFFIIFWSACYFFWQISTSEQEALFWLNFLTVGSIFIPVIFYHFSCIFLKLYKKVFYRIIFYIGLGYAISVPILAFTTDFFVKGVETRLGLKLWPIAGNFYWSWLIVFFSFFIISLLLFFREYRKSSGIYREQIKFILIGISLGAFGGATNFPLWYNIPVPPFGNVLVSIYIFFVGYAIIKYRFMDIKLVLRKSSVYFLSLGTILALTFLAKVLTNNFLEEFDFWVDILVLFSAIFAFPYLKDYYSKVANKYFFTSLYDSGKLILKTGNDLKTFLNIEKVYDYLNDIFSKNLHTRKFGVLNYISDYGKYKLQYNKGFNVEQGDFFDKNDFTEREFINKNRIIVTEELKSAYNNRKTENLIQLLDNLRVELLIPLKVKGNLIGLLALGSKETNEAYNDEDLQMLETVAGQAAIAIENAQLYSEVKKFNTKLRAEVKKATEALEEANKNLKGTNKKLKEVNDRLKQLDSAKNEFISIASHQLRTPLTSIKGFISMIREGDYGKINGETDEALRKMYLSNERLIKLVNDLLSVSRIESGKFTFHFEESDVLELARMVVHNSQLEAKEQKLKLNFIEPKKKIKSFNFDKDKMNEVVSNLVDNALKYTPKGKVEVSLEDMKDAVKIIISDTGKGMEKEELKYVFEKFRRGVDSVSHNTEGTGLGLYVCNKIIKAHKSKIYAESDGPGKGSRFIVELNKNLKVGK